MRLDNCVDEVRAAATGGPTTRAVRVRLRDYPARLVTLCDALAHLDASRSAAPASAPFVGYSCTETVHE
jgi:hypothetical protein